MSPEAQRRAILGLYCLDEKWLEGLKKLDAEEAEWRIRHEHEAAIRFSEQRMNWTLIECGIGVSMPRPPDLSPAGDVTIVRVRRTVITPLG